MIGSADSLRKTCQILETSVREVLFVFRLVNKRVRGWVFIHRKAAGDLVLSAFDCSVESFLCSGQSRDKVNCQCMEGYRGGQDWLE